MSNTALPATAGYSNHANLSNLDYASSGHTLFGTGRGCCEALRIATATAATVVVTANAITVPANTGNGGVTHTGISKTVDITTSGVVNGLDTGSEASSTWYYIWIWSDGSTYGCCFSTSSTSITDTRVGSPPITHKKLIGAVYNNSSSNFATFIQIDNRVYYPGSANSWGALSAGSSTSVAELSISLDVPPIAQALVLQLAVTSGDGYMCVYSDSSGTYWGATCPNDVSTAISSYIQEVTIMITTSQKCYYKMAGTPTNRGYASVMGWIFCL